MSTEATGYRIRETFTTARIQVGFSLPEYCKELSVRPRGANEFELNLQVEGQNVQDAKENLAAICEELQLALAEHVDAASS